MNGQVIGEAAVGGLIVLKQAADWLGGRRRDKSQKLAFAEFRLTLEERLAGFDRRIDKLFAFVIGPDGENGIRGDLRAVEARVDAFEEREREHEREHLARPVYDRRTGT